ncbi:hypothetical protein AKJ42_02140 [candidate division MSBL1 archaeon SCGC-AAA261C02]|uniref:Transposase n=1 Tax=candidate division MSBL1 archaeon SCGC-AAA261C02 TaxID=1698272 RepID=A0A133V0L4_9EURY|nr:hypothetical protein AKJ42_02140 [candidate division MSBL1 archaeon SCGC-AAA261C02]
MKRVLRQNLRGLNCEDYGILRSMCRLSKNLYNSTLYEVRQHFFDNGEYLSYYNVWRRLKGDFNYELLPSQAAQHTVMHVHRAFRSFFKLVKMKRRGEYEGETRPPGYLDKDGFFSLNLPNQSFQVKEDYIRIGIPQSFRREFNCERTEIRFPFTYEEVKAKEIKQLQVIPKAKAQYFEYRLIYEEEKTRIETEKGTWLSIDLNVDNLAVCGDHSGRSFILDGRKLKSINRWYNREIARLQSIKDKQGIQENTRRTNKLYRDRRNKIHDYFNKAVHWILEYCKANKIELVLVGDGKEWKQESEMGDKNNQNFMQIPFDLFKRKLKAKLELHGINFELVEESHTSKCSFSDGEPVEHHEEYVGTRVKRGLFKTSNGILVNADVNGYLNIARKYFEENGEKGKLKTLKGVESSGVVATPRRIREPFEFQPSLKPLT